MKAIEMKGDDGQYVGLLLDPKKPEAIVGAEELNRLKPYVLHLLFQSSSEDPSLKNRFVVTKLSEGNRAAFTIDGEKKEASQKLLHKIQHLCKQGLTEQEALIVPQYMGSNAPVIRHRPMEFQVQEDQMVVKYVTLGDFNNFDAAMKKVAALYPEVEQTS